MYTCCQLCPSQCFWNEIWLGVGISQIQIGEIENPLMNQPRTLSLFVLRHRIWCFHMKCETPTDGWTDTFHFFFSIPPFLDKDTLPQQRPWDERQSWIHNYHNTVLDKWTLTCLSHNKLIVPHKVSILTAPQTHTTPILSTHKKSVDFPAL